MRAVEDDDGTGERNDPLHEPVLAFDEHRDEAAFEGGEGGLGDELGMVGGGRIANRVHDGGW